MLKLFEVLNSFDERIIDFLMILLVFIFKFVWKLEDDGFSLWPVYKLEDDVEEDECSKKEEPGLEELVSEDIEL